MKQRLVLSGGEGESLAEPGARQASMRSTAIADGMGRRWLASKSGGIPTSSTVPIPVMQL